MRALTERAYFVLCLASGRLLRSARYSTVRIVDQLGERHVRKRRRLYAPLLVWIGGVLVKVLDTGVRVLPQRDWEARERLLYSRLHAGAVRVEGGGTLLLPWLPGKTLASLLESPVADAADRRKAMELAVIALAELHRAGFTHGDAMAENVMIDLEGDAAYWFDFENEHDPNRPLAWRRADDLRALLVTCVVRTHPADPAETLRLILDTYGDEGVTPLLADSFTSVTRRPLAFHLGQAAVSYRQFTAIGLLLSDRRRSVRDG